MTTLVRRSLGVVLAIAVTAGLAALSGVARDPTDQEAVLRLSWRARSERVQRCRALTAEEQASQPAHMRRTEECEGRVLPYRLEVELDGRRLVSETVHGGGARQDRPVYVFHELPVAPRRARLEVRFVREDQAGGAADPVTESPVRPGATPARLELTREVDLRPGEVALVTYDPDRAELVLRSPDASH